MEKGVWRIITCSVYAQHLDSLLNAGWEPFAGTTSQVGDTIWLRKLVTKKFSPTPPNGEGK